MRRFHITAIGLLLTVFCTVYGVSAQKLLLVEKPGTVKNYKFEKGDRFILMKKGDSRKVDGTITQLLDTSFVIDYQYLINFSEINKVYKVRGLANFMTELGIKGGLGFFLVDFTNNLIQHDLLINPLTLKISGGFIATALVFRIIRHKPLKLGPGWRLRIIDPDSDTFK